MWTLLCFLKAMPHTFISMHEYLLATENFIEIYNNVNLYDTKSTLQADKINYNFETKNFKVSMFDNKSVKMKVIKWAM